MQPTNNKPTILVVDDSPDNIHVLLGILKTNYEVKAAVNGKQALRIATKTQPPDLILLDIMMPGMDGYEVCQQLKNNPITKDIPVIFLSAVSEIEERVMAFSVGGVDFVGKPFVAEELIARVETHLTLNHLKKDLEKQLEERIIAHRQALDDVRRHRDQLTHLNRLNSMSELAASLAHELNQPLTAIVTNAQAAQYYLDSDSQDLDEVREVLQDISADGMRAAEIIKRTRALMKKGEISRQPISIPDMIQGVIKLLLNEGIRASVPIRLDVEHEISLYPGDRTQFEQVLLNLMLNSIEAMVDTPEESRELIISVRQPDIDTIEIAVQDTGIGLNEEMLALIFTQFYTTKPEGLGMGLAICKSIVEAHGGCLWAEQNEGLGATFFISLPLDIPVE